MRTLYFEGAGCEGTQRNDIENCRIRTAFTNDKGRKIYLEITSYEKSANDKKIKRYEEYQINDAIGFIDFAFYIDTESKDPCNECRIKDFERSIKFTYNKETLIKTINKYLDCSFDSIIILNSLTGYNVHGDNRQYNLMDNYIYEPELIMARKEIEKHFYNLEKSEGKQYPNFSLWVDGEDKNLLHLLRHFNGYNKHWSIRTDVEKWMNSIEETKLGKYAC